MVNSIRLAPLRRGFSLCRRALAGAALDPLAGNVQISPRRSMSGFPAGSSTSIRWTNETRPRIRTTLNFRPHPEQVMFRYSPARGPPMKVWPRQSGQMPALSQPARLMCAIGVFIPLGGELKHRHRNFLLNQTAVVGAVGAGCAALCGPRRTRAMVSVANQRTRSSSTADRLGQSARPTCGCRCCRECNDGTARYRRYGPYRSYPAVRRFNERTSPTTRRGTRCGAHCPGAYAGARANCGSSNWRHARLATSRKL
jgi:hypothetical protein